MLLFLAVLLIGLIVASIMDFKSLYVSDYFQDTLIAFGIIGNLIYSLSTGKIDNLLWMSVGILIFIPIAYILYLLKYWGGGDVKATMMLVTILPYFNKPLIFDYAINFIFISGIYSVLISLWIGRKELKKKEIYKAIAVATIAVLAFLFLPKLFAWLITLLALLLAFSNTVYKIDQTLTKKVDPSELVEEDWLVEDVYYKGKKIIEAKGLHPLTKEEIEFLKKHGIKVKIKFGIPMVPAFLLTVIVTLLIGNILFL